MIRIRIAEHLNDTWKKLKIDKFFEDEKCQIRSRDLSKFAIRSTNYKNIWNKQKKKETKKKSQSKKF